MVDCDLNRKILHGDVLEKLKEITDNSIDCIITSPPYFLGSQGLWCKRPAWIGTRF